MDAAKWSQGFQDHTSLVKPMEDMVSNNTCPRPTLEKKTRPPEQLNCPRCNSTNTKFCYYNNYSLTQPRYFCKTCRRYWTEGGSLRNVPVGGGSRKNKRSSTSSSSSSSTKVPDINPQFSSQNPKSMSTSPHKGQDLNLAFPAMQEGTHVNLSQFLQVPKIENNFQSSTSPSSTSYGSSALEMLRTSGMVSGGLNSFVPGSIPDPNTLFSSGFSMQDYKPPTLRFSIDGFGSRGGIQENGGRVFFPFGEVKSTSSEIDDHNKRQGNSSGYWTNGVLGGGSWQ
ncbi:hypothetical protein SLA2020_291790 [Shorea laevis]